MIEAPNEQFCTAGDVELCYETFGDPGGEPLLLIMGLGTQMIGWHVDFCRELVGRGFYVIRYDNRDVGRSQKFDDTPPPQPVELLTRRLKHVAYTLEDMADDGVNLLECLGIESAHVVGASMGGMIAQTIAARHPARVRSLVSIMSTTGNRLKGQPALKLYPMFLAKPPRGRDASIERTMKVYRAIGSRGLPQDTELIREMAERSWERGHDRFGPGRQLAAINASGNRTKELKRITAPTTVIHGSDDLLVRKSGGKATARAIPGARYVEIDGMGHDLPSAAWDQIIDAIVANAERAGHKPPTARAAA